MNPEEKMQILLLLYREAGLLVPPSLDGTTATRFGALSQEEIVRTVGPVKICREFELVEEAIKALEGEVDGDEFFKICVRQIKKSPQLTAELLGESF